jgi:NADH-quinone oxidoreductase subunit J
MSLFIYCVYGLLLFSALLMILCINPIHAVLFFILVFCCAALLFTLLHIDFIGLVFLMVYVGAIAVLFIFVVMMLNIKRIERDTTTYLLIGGLICLLLFIQLLYLFFSGNNMHSPHGVVFGDVLLFDVLTNNDELLTKHFVLLAGMLLFSDLAVIIIFSCITLLVALVGSIYLTNSATGYSLRRQDNQVSRNNKLFNLHIY